MISRAAAKTLTVFERGDERLAAFLDPGHVWFQRRSHVELLDLLAELLRQLLPVIVWKPM
jgi:uncharacterized protein (AIM24 family)